nr:GntR family transcriptional regulator [Pectobacterium brasiliense]
MPEKLPPERQLAEEYGVSRFTIRQALEKLASIGAIHMVQGSGNFINQGVRSNPLVYNSITEKKLIRFHSVCLACISGYRREKSNRFLLSAKIRSYGNSAGTLRR